MQTKQLSKTQFVVTVTETELLIIDAYSQLFQVSLQDSALIMCVHGWNSYGKLMTQYSKNCALVPQSHKANKLLKNHQTMLNLSDEAIDFRKSMSKVTRELKDI